MKDHLRILERAANGSLPEEIDEGSSVSIDIVRELFEAGYLWAIDASTISGDAFLNPRITIQGRQYLNDLQQQVDAADRELLSRVDRLRSILITVATGGPRIDEVNAEYQSDFEYVDRELKKRQIQNPIPFRSLWDWHGRWSSGDLPNYRSRREFVAALINPLLDKIRSGVVAATVTHVDPTGWPRVDRGVGEARKRLADASSEEQFQTVGLLCREILISLAQAVHDPVKHPPTDGVAASDTDAKRKFDAYIAVELAGHSNDAARKHARAAYELAVTLQHQRTASFRHAALCLEATSSVVNSIAILSGRRDRP